MNRRLFILGIGFAVLVFILAFVWVPTGRPTTYGRNVAPSYELIWTIEGSRLIDMGRVWFQTILFGGVAGLCFYLGRKSKGQAGHQENV